MGANGIGTLGSKALQPTWKTKYLLLGVGVWRGQGGREPFVGEG